MTASKGTNIAYWITTGLLAFALAGSGMMNILQPPELVEGMGHLGYPLYFLTIIGVWKLLGVAAILAPRFPALKEWAYAGIVFDLSGAVISHLASGDGLGEAAVPVVLTVLAVASYLLRPEARRLPGTPGVAPSAGAVA